MPILTSVAPLIDIAGRPVETYLRIRSQSDEPFNFATIRIVNGQLFDRVNIAPGIYEVAWGRGRWEDILIVQPIYSHVWDVPNVNAIELIDLQNSAIFNGTSGWMPDFLQVDIQVPRNVNRSLPKPKKRIYRSSSPVPSPSPSPSPVPTPTPSTNEIVLESGDRLISDSGDLIVYG